MDRVRRLAVVLLEKNRALFTTDFEKNKQILLTVARVTSKQLRNEIAGYITSFLREETQKIEQASPEALVAQAGSEAV